MKHLGRARRINLHGLHVPVGIHRFRLHPDLKIRCTPCSKISADFRTAFKLGDHAALLPELLARFSPHHSHRLGGQFPAVLNHTRLPIRIKSAHRFKQLSCLLILFQSGHEITVFFQLLRCPDIQISLEVDVRGIELGILRSLSHDPDQHDDIRAKQHRPSETRLGFCNSFKHQRQRLSSSPRFASAIFSQDPIRQQNT